MRWGGTDAFKEMKENKSVWSSQQRDATVQVWPVMRGLVGNIKDPVVLSGPGPATKVLSVKGGRGWTRADISVQ